VRLIRKRQAGEDEKILIDTALCLFEYPVGRWRIRTAARGSETGQRGEVAFQLAIVSRAWMQAIGLLRVVRIT
jgi:hypothetical protein